MLAGVLDEKASRKNVKEPISGGRKTSGRREGGNRIGPNAGDGGARKLKNKTHGEDSVSLTVRPELCCEDVQMKISGWARAVHRVCATIHLHPAGPGQ